MSEQGSPCWYEEQVSFMPELDSPRRSSHPEMGYNHPLYSCKQELELQYNIPHESFLQLPHLESPNIPPLSASVSCNSLSAYGLQPSSLTQDNQMHKNHRHSMTTHYNNNNDQGVEQVTDWRVLDKFVASQLSQEDISKEPNYTNTNGANIFHVSDNMTNILAQESNKQEMGSEYASTSTSSCHIDLWK
ncbi:hypothetical protein GIB67_008778 [Kingdonia uniflora]|uniref:Uncharacterized protein n=1 Tax=Kingdonia uniflora TaxID=39325 RepID=A0A7J7P5X6_9MAGN|nr:hypothetical protein GIB67_008778 [Kingdonia uniflora]